jgi:nucleoside-diphosphate kinase
VTIERRLIPTKPDAAHRRLAAEILGWIEAGGFEIREAKLVTASRQLGEEQYAEHREKPFRSELVELIISGPTPALVVEGEGAIATLRPTMGPTHPANGAPGTIRGVLASSMPDNLVHGRDSPESAEREIALWFGA